MRTFSECVSGARALRAEQLPVRVRAHLAVLSLQYKKHTEYERAAKVLVDEVTAQRDHVVKAMKQLEVRVYTVRACTRVCG